jgi:amino acid transporter
MANNYNPKRVLSVFSLVMINVIAVDSIRTLPMAASFGFSLVTLYIIAALTFFIPTALITAELATTWPAKGGMYTWVKLAFGPKAGVCVVYLQWIYNVIWYPTVLTLISSTMAFLFWPEVINNPIFMVATVLSTFWICTLINFAGMKVSSIISTIGSILGTLGPMLVIIIMCFVWLKKGNQPEISLEAKNLIPPITAITDLVFFTQIVYSLLGLEMSSVHAMEVKNPKKDYPRALLISSVVIISSLILASLTIAIVVPEKSLDNLTGLIQAYQLFSIEFNMPWIGPMIAGAITIGGISAVATWIIGPTKGLFAAASDNLLPQNLAKVNKHNVPTNILFIQGIVCTFLCLAYLLLPTIEGAYFALSALAAQLSLFMYAILFLASIRLRYSHKDTPRPFKIPGGNWGIWLVAGTGFLLSTSIVLLGFVPPSKVNLGNVFYYELFLVFGFVLFLSPIFYIHKLNKK